MYDNFSARAKIWGNPPPQHPNAEQTLKLHIVELKFWISEMYDTFSAQAKIWGNNLAIETNGILYITPLKQF